MILAPYKEQIVTEDPQCGTPAASFATDYPLSILIAEDNSINQKLIERILSKLGYQTDTVSDGIHVFEMIEKKKYNVILMDVRMPEMDGYEATHLIRKTGIEQPYIIAMTANAMLSDKEECLDMGMNDYLSKPLRLEEIIKVLKTASFRIREKN